MLHHYIKFIILKKLLFLSINQIFISIYYINLYYIIKIIQIALSVSGVITSLNILKEDFALCINYFVTSIIF